MKLFFEVAPKRWIKCQIVDWLTLANTSSGKAQAGQSSGPLVPAAGAKGRSPAGAAGEKAKSPAEAKAHLAPQPSPGARTLLENLAPASKGEGSPHQKTEVEGVVGEETCGAGPCSCSAGQVRSPRQQFCLPGELLLAVQAHARQVEEGGRRAQSGRSSRPSSSLISSPPSSASLLMACATMLASISW